MAGWMQAWFGLNTDVRKPGQVHIFIRSSVSNRCWKLFQMLSDPEYGQEMPFGTSGISKA